MQGAGVLYGALRLWRSGTVRHGAIRGEAGRGGAGSHLRGEPGWSGLWSATGLLLEQKGDGVREEARTLSKLGSKRWVPAINRPLPAPLAVQRPGSQGPGRVDPPDPSHRRLIAAITLDPAGLQACALSAMVPAMLFFGSLALLDCPAV